MQASAAMEPPSANDLCRRCCLLGCGYRVIYETKPLSFHEAVGIPVMPDIAQIISLSPLRVSSTRMPKARHFRSRSVTLSV
jgi:hypothetical protein